MKDLIAQPALTRQRSTKISKPNAISKADSGTFKKSPLAHSPIQLGRKMSSRDRHEPNHQNENPPLAELIR